LSGVLIFDASTLILLAKAELLDIFLDDFKGAALLPEAVEAECVSQQRLDGMLIQQRIREGRLVVEPVRQPRVTARLMQDFRIGLGEAEALALALEKEEDAAVVATDDRNAIRACKVLRLEFVSSLGILVRAVEKRLLTPDDGKKFLGRLVSCGRFKAGLIEEVSLQIEGALHGKATEDR
jgi:predicted nucleic acid-binding protein